MRELFIASRILADGAGGEDQLCYYVLVEDVRAGGRFLYESYGVRVTASRPGQRREESVRNVTLSARELDWLMERLIRNRVTPETLRDVLVDHIESA